MGRNSLSQHERNEVTLFRRGTFSAKHVVAVSSKPFFRFRLVAVTLWIPRRRHRLNVLARAGLPGLLGSVVWQVVQDGVSGLPVEKLVLKRCSPRSAENLLKPGSEAFASFA